MMNKWPFEIERDYDMPSGRRGHFLIHGEITWLGDGEFNAVIVKIEKLMASGSWIDYTNAFSDRAKANFADELWLAYNEEREMRESGLIK